MQELELKLSPMLLLKLISHFSFQKALNSLVCFVWSQSLLFCLKDLQITPLMFEKTCLILHLNQLLLIFLLCLKADVPVFACVISAQTPTFTADFQYLQSLVLLEVSNLSFTGRFSLLCLFLLVQDKQRLSPSL